MQSWGRPGFLLSQADGPSHPLPSSDPPTTLRWQSSRRIQDIPPITRCVLGPSRSPSDCMYWLTCIFVLLASLWVAASVLTSVAVVRPRAGSRSPFAPRGAGADPTAPLPLSFSNAGCWPRSSSGSRGRRLLATGRFVGPAYSSIVAPRLTAREPYPCSQVWRALTNFLYFGPMSVELVLHLFFM